MDQKLRIMFFTHDSLYSTRVLTELLQTPMVELVGIVQSTTIMRRNHSVLNDGLRLLSTCGIRYTAYLLRTSLFYRKMAEQHSLIPLKKLVKKYDIPLITSNDVNTPEVISFINKTAPDICVTAFFNQRIKANVLRLPAKGFINLHPALLPKNRGVDPVFYAYLRKESGGVTIHFIENTLDTGPILMQEPLELDFEQSLLMNQWNHFDKGSLLLRNVLTHFDAYLPGKCQQGAGNYDGWPNKRSVRMISKLT